MKKIFLFIIAVCFLFSFTNKEITWVAIGDSITYLND
ncbi:MAG: SGNH/GDSL hydrolase family protein, partial [Chitinophagaceae bacterium]|nr:SGNH/GDSL hydrolase family protein [Chitinophagaceae bacterium]